MHPHIKIYVWPNVPSDAKRVADQLDLDGISYVAHVPPDLAYDVVRAIIAPFCLHDAGEGEWWFL